MVSLHVLGFIITTFHITWMVISVSVLQVFATLSHLLECTVSLKPQNKFGIHDMSRFPYSQKRSEVRTPNKWRKPQLKAIALVRRYAKEHSGEYATPYLVGQWLVENDLTMLSSDAILLAFETIGCKQIPCNEPFGPPRYFIMP